MLIVHGDADQNVPADVSAKRSHELLPNSELVLIPGGSHGIYATHTDQVNQALLDFLGRL
jgi:pimeloyl-ACP methyl ester carboxylesterase